MSEKRIKILYVITKSNWGGAQRYVYDLATNLPREQFDVVVALGGNGLLKEKLAAANIRVVAIKNFQRDIHLFKEFRSLRELFRIYKTERPDIIHLNSSKAGGLGAFAGRMAGVKKIIFTAHGWAYHEQRPLLQKLLLRCMQWLTVFLAHTVIAVSAFVQQSAPTFLIRKSKIVTVRNGIEATELLEKDRAREILLGNHADACASHIWIGTVSELHPNKGLVPAIRAVKNLPDTLFVIIGEGTQRAELETLIQKENLSEKVFLVGHKKDASSLLRAFDIFTLTSTTEALGYVLLEAGMADLPVIASRVGGIPEIIEDGKNGLLIDPNSDTAISAALQKLIGDPSLRRSFGENLKQKITREFTRADMVSKTIECYSYIK